MQVQSILPMSVAERFVQLDYHYFFIPVSIEYYKFKKIMTLCVLAYMVICDMAWYEFVSRTMMKKDNWKVDLFPCLLFDI